MILSPVEYSLIAVDDPNEYQLTFLYMASTLIQLNAFSWLDVDPSSKLTLPKHTFVVYSS